jgi:anaphase-promoting complex subunit 2
MVARERDGADCSRPFMAPFSLGSIFARLSPGADERLLHAHSSAPLQALILSRHYWPSTSLKDDNQNFRLPSPLEECLIEYGRWYSQIKPKRSLAWKRSQGRAEISVQLADRRLELVVSPTHLAVLSAFEAPDGHLPVRFTMQELCSRLELPEALVKKRVTFWVSKTVLREAGGVFEVQESLSAEGSWPGGQMDEEDQSPGQAGGVSRGSGRGACAAELKACEGFIHTALSSKGSLPLGRIHNFLMRFMTDPPCTMTEAELRDFLALLCQDGRLEFSGSAYSLLDWTLAAR